MTPTLVAFDVDGTLTVSKQPITKECATLLGELLSKTKVVFVSGGGKELALTQIIPYLPPESKLENLSLLPTSGAVFMVFRGGAWESVYENTLTSAEVKHISEMLQRVAEELGIIDFSGPSYGERIENRGSQVSLSALGQLAPVPEKEAWDPTREKREKIRAMVAPLLPEFSVKLGGLTTLDVTKKGIDKAYGIRKLSEHYSIPISTMLYVGDALFPGGNDEVVKETGITTEQTSGPAETMDIIKRLIYSEHGES